MIRSFAANQTQDTFDPLPFLKVAERHTTPLSNGDTFLWQQADRYR